MDLQDFGAEPLYFDEPLSPEVERLLAQAAERYGNGPEDDAAEQALLRAYFLEPEHPTVLVALYRFFYYRRRYAEALVVADRAIAISAVRLGLPARWQELSEGVLGPAVLASMTLTRFLLLALKGSGYLLLRLGDPAAALDRLEKVAEIDTSDRLGVQTLANLAREAITQAAVQRLGARSPTSPASRHARPHPHMPNAMRPGGTMIDDDFDADLEALESAEDFLEYFQIPYDRNVVQVNRLHILQRFHDYLADVDEMPDGARPRWVLYAELLGAAYQDFVVSDALTEKVFRVFHTHRPQEVRIPVDDLLGQLAQPGPAAQEGPHAA